jgi:hypothetical protein
MHIEYDITEQEFLHAQQLVHRITTPKPVQWFEVASPFLGLALLIFGIEQLATQGLSALFVLCLGMGSYLLFLPLLSKNRQKQLYRNSDFLHGKPVLEVDDKGVRFGGQTGGLEIGWSALGRCIEDHRAIVIMPKKKRTFQVVPKRCLSSPQMNELRECLKQRVGPGRVKVDQRNPNRPPTLSSGHVLVSGKTKK